MLHLLCFWEEEGNGRQTSIEKEECNRFGFG